MTRSQGSGRWPELIKSSFGKSFWVFVLFALAAGVACYVVLGPEAFASAVDKDREIISNLLPRVAAAQIVAGLVWVLLPRDRLSQMMQNNAGKRGLVLATAAGLVTPGGPASAFPFLAIIAAAGADRGILVAYITSWAILGVQRVIVWDIPFMGMEFSLLRFFLCLPLPIIAGLLARRLPFAVVLDERPMTGKTDT